MGNPAYVASGSFAITPSDGTDLTIHAEGIYVTGAGDVKFIGADGVTDTVTLPANSFYPCKMRRIYSTLTTATGIHGFRR